MKLKAVSLNDKYTQDSGKVYITGNQALVRLPLMQKQRDLIAGLNTAGYISGYRGSPIGTYDFELQKAQQFLDSNDVVFQPGINEDLAATSVWGSQQVETQEDKKYDGVFALWYGKGPGVFRSGDVLKHGSFYGASRHGGVLLVPGDDYIAKSSTIAHYSDPEMIAHGSPILYPATIQEVIDYGLIGWALSRYSGAWVTLKVVNETVEGTATVDLDPSRSDTREPLDQDVPPQAHFVPPKGGLGPAREAERMAYSGRIPLVKAFARLNKLDRPTIEASRRKLGIVASGKAHQDVLRALQLLGIDHEKAIDIGMSLYKVAMPWPLEDESFSEFAQGHEELLILEEKLPIMEQQITQLLYNWPEGTRPRIIGKLDDKGESLQNTYGSVEPNYLMSVIASRLATNSMMDVVIEAAITQSQSRLAGGCGAVVANVVRTPYFCSGCPHNRSTIVPKGSKALGGIGCHAMAEMIPDRNTTFPVQMGGEGHNWVGMAHFVESEHRFQNLGDGTYTHSGLHAVHAAVAQGVNITYKILYNDAVAMTGGQATEGALTPQQISKQVVALGAKRVVVTTDDPDKYQGQQSFAVGVSVYHRDELDRLQQELRDVKGVTVLINDQTCAAEKRRRRKRGQFPDPDKRMFINELVCEACGDCSVQSNCVSLQAKKTEFGNKRFVDQSTCNKDYSCVDGFCPSFVTVYGGKLRKAEAAEIESSLFADLPEPLQPEFEHAYAILINGIGGTGVVTIGAVLGMAAHLENKSISIYDMTGLAQKGGAVQSHLRISKRQEDITAIPIGPGDADLILGCDLVVTAGEASMRSINPGHTKAIINTDPVGTAAFQQMRDFEVPASTMAQGIKKAMGNDAVMVDVSKIAYALLGNSIAANMLIVGYAYQQGWLPVSAAAIEKAIELNAVSIEFNRTAFLFGRLAAHDMDRIEPIIQDYLQVSKPDVANTREDALRRRMEYLCSYQNKEYALRYQQFVNVVTQAEVDKLPGQSALSEAVLRNYFKLLAYKDEYEVARLYTNGEFLEKLESQFEGRYKLAFNLAPPLIARRNKTNGQLKKRQFGAWMMHVFKLLAKLKCLRGTPFDVFSYTGERRMERLLITEYEETIAGLLPHLSPKNYDIAVQVAQQPAEIRGFGHVKEASIEKARIEKTRLLSLFEKGGNTIASDESARFYDAS